MRGIAIYQTIIIFILLQFSKYQTQLISCPADMKLIQAAKTFCMDIYEAPNVKDSNPLVMFSYVEAQAWCNAKNKRLCYDDSEWTITCSGTHNYLYPYGNTYQPGKCNDNKTWKQYNQTILNWWPISASSSDINSLEELFLKASKYSPHASACVDHLKWLYQAKTSGESKDLCGNIEEWTTRNDGGNGTLFHGNLKGRYWSETRTCAQNVKVHGDLFHFYEIGFRCCKDI